MKEQDYLTGLEQPLPGMDEEGPVVSDIFSKEENHIVQTILLMRIYDVLLGQFTCDHPEQAAKLAEAHSTGQIIGSMPSLSIPE